MKKLIYLLVAIFTFLATSNSHAAFPVKKVQQIVPQTIAPEHSARHITGNDHNVKRSAVALINLLRPYHKATSSPYDDNTNGTLSLVFALVGIVFPPLLIPAIVLGAVGLHNRESCALAGLITSVVIVILYTILIAATIFGAF